MVYNSAADMTMRPLPTERQQEGVLRPMTG